ncbi:MAG TPA: right-handed parallel beta-helix repeat-containing protein [Steroidobacteraceae bacterium]
MTIKGRSILGVGVFSMLAGLVAFASWYESQRASRPSTVMQKTVLAHVTNSADRGPGTLRESLFLVAGATGPASILIEVPSIKLETALPPFISSHEVRLVAQPAGAQIDARALSEGPVLDIAGAYISIEGITIQGCPGIAVLVRAVHFRLSKSVIQSCDVGVEIAENASDTVLEHNKFAKDRLGVRFGASHRNSVVANNEFIEDKVAGLWAARSAPDSHDEPIAIHDNKFTADGNAIVAGNVPVLVERNDFINSREAAVHVVGAGAVIRGNHVSGGASMGIVGENARGAIIEGNELEGLTAYGIMLHGSSNVLVRGNRLHNCGYGIAFVLGDLHNVSTAVDNTIIEPKFNGIDVIGDSPSLRHNSVLHPHANALHVEDFQPPNGQKVASQPVLDNNNFDSGSIQGATAASQPLAK